MSDEAVDPIADDPAPNPLPWKRIIVSLLFLYVLSIGPVEATIGSRAVEEYVGSRMYFPIEWATERSEIVDRMVGKYCGFWELLFPREPVEVTPLRCEGRP